MNPENNTSPLLMIVGRTWSAEANKRMPRPLADESIMVH